MKSCVVIFTFIFLGAKYVQSQTLPTKKEQYSFLQWFTKNRGIAALSDTSIKFCGDFESLSSIDKSLSKSAKIAIRDRQYLRMQIKNADKNQKLDTTLLKVPQWGKDTLQSFVSLPIFTLSRKFAFINYRYYCGEDCGYAGIEVYVKTKPGKWQKSKLPLHFAHVVY